MYGAWLPDPGQLCNGPRTSTRDGGCELTTRNTTELLTKAEVASLFKISQRTLGNEMALGRIEYHRVGGQVRFTQEQVDAYLARQSRRAS